MPEVHANDIVIHFDRFGTAGDPSLLLVNGLGTQSIGWDVEFCLQLAANGFDVIRYDNRDVGLSSHLVAEDLPDVLEAFATVMGGGEVPAPYTLSDMAADGMALLDSLEVEAAHLLGTSMGGMIVQTMAVEHPQRVRSLTSVMSTTGEAHVGTPHPDCLAGLAGIMAPAATREARIESGVQLQKLIGTPTEWDEERVRARATEQVDRCYDPTGVTRQMLAILASGSREQQLPEITAPTMVLHGDADRLVDISGGRRTAELVPGSEFRQLGGMGHDLPPAYWDRAVEAIRDVAVRAA